MPHDIEEMMGAFVETDYTPKLCRGIFKVVPFAPPLPHYGSLVETLQVLEPEGRRKALDHARELTRGEEFQRTLWMANALDTADSGISVFSGVKSAVAMYQAKEGERLDALETDQQQAADAVLKGLGLAFMAYHLFPGSIAEKADAFQKSETGKALMLYYAAVEVGLPFADNALLGGGQFLSGLFQKFGDDKLTEFASITGEQEAQEAVGLLQRLMGPLEKMITMASGYLGPMAEAAAANLPKALNVADKVAGVVATGADAMPVYRYLGARLVAEVAVARALEEVGTGELFAAPVHDPSDPVSTPIRYSTTTEDPRDALPEAPPRKKRGCFLKSLFFGTFLLSISGAGAAAGWQLITAIAG